MPLCIEPPGEPGNFRPWGPETPDAHTPVVVGLVNNMPDAALGATEAQFSSLLRDASGPLRVLLRLTALRDVPRSGAALKHIGLTYWPLETLLEDPPDALIVTGAEPVALELSNEPYWRTFVQLVDWVQEYAVSSIWSCLAAHAAVQHLSGIQRRRLVRKRCGVYDHSVLEGHALTRGLTDPWITPHSRWNDLPIDRLDNAGYTILSESLESGANVFIRKTRGPLMIFLQGHPEYEDTTLLKEYRRDTARFLRGQQPHYPGTPDGYFSPTALSLLDAFQRYAAGQRSIDIMDAFPSAEVQQELRNTWRASATALYANWLTAISTTKSQTTSLPLRML